MLLDLQITYAGIPYRNVYKLATLFSRDRLILSRNIEVCTTWWPLISHLRFPFRRYVRRRLVSWQISEHWNTLFGEFKKRRRARRRILRGTPSFAAVGQWQKGGKDAIKAFFSKEFPSLYKKDQISTQFFLSFCIFKRLILWLVNVAVFPRTFYTNVFVIFWR